jgi:hypothetical protein
MIDSLVDLACFKIKQKLTEHPPYPNILEDGWREKDKLFYKIKQKNQNMFNMLPHELKSRINKMPENRLYIVMFKCDGFHCHFKRAEYYIRIVSELQIKDEVNDGCFTTFMGSFLIPLVYVPDLDRNSLFGPRKFTIWYSLTEKPHLSWIELPGYTSYNVFEKKYEKIIIKSKYMWDNNKFIHQFFTK